MCHMHGETWHINAALQPGSLQNFEVQPQQSLIVPIPTSPLELTTHQSSKCALIQSLGQLVVAALETLHGTHSRMLLLWSLDKTPISEGKTYVCELMPWTAATEDVADAMALVLLHFHAEFAHQ